MSANMPVTLLRCPPGGDRVQVVATLLRRAQAEAAQPVPRIWLLLSSVEQQAFWRQRLLEQRAGRALGGLQVLRIDRLPGRVLQLLGQPQRRLSALMRRKLLRQLLDEMLAAGQLPTFGGSAGTAGFVTIAARQLDELQRQGISPSALAAAAQNDKDREIAAIFRRYQDALQQGNFCDRAGEWQAATEALRAASFMGPAHLLHDGIDPPSPVQAQLLAQLAAISQQAHFVLPTHATGAAAAQASLQRALSALDIPQRLRSWTGGASRHHIELQQLRRSLFSADVAGGSSEALQLLALPDMDEEVRAVLRRVKGRLLAGTQPEDILIVLRDWAQYASLFEAAKDAYELPLALQRGRPLAQEPIIATLLDLLQLAPRYPRQGLLDILRSPYIDAQLSPEQIDRLDSLSRERRFPGGRADEWRKLLLSAGAYILWERLEAFFLLTRPPRRATLAAQINWLHALLGTRTDAAPSLRIWQGAAALSDSHPALAERDLRALQGTVRCLQALLESERALESGQRYIPWAQFCRELQQALETVPAVPPTMPAGGHVRVCGAEQARGLQADHVYILGLAEGLFPQEPVEDPFYLDSEREALQARGIPLETRAQRKDDRALFLDILDVPQVSLTLSRPSYRAGQRWLASYLWRAVRATFPAQPEYRLAAGAVIPPQQAASGQELLLALADRLNEPESDAAQAALGKLRWLRGQPALAASWGRVRRGRALELGRLSSAPYDASSGVLSRAALLRECAQQLGSDAVWSASRLKDYGLCGFRYFAKHMLGLAEAVEPEPGIDVMQLGSLQHSILEKTYSAIHAQGIAINETERKRALAIFGSVAVPLLADAPVRWSFHAGASWEQEQKLLYKRLRAVIAQDFSPGSPASAFGEARRVQALERYVEQARIELPGDEPAIQVRAFIDRIDEVDGQLAVIDYKSGNRPIGRSEMEQGRDFQMMIYLLALEQAVTGQPIAGGLFWHLRNRSASGIFRYDSEQDRAALELARQQLARQLQMGRAGQFPVHATRLENGKCARYCEYSHLCRHRVTSRHKALPVPAG